MTQLDRLHPKGGIPEKVVRVESSSACVRVSDSALLNSNCMEPLDRKLGRDERDAQIAQVLLFCGWKEAGLN